MKPSTALALTALVTLSAAVPLEKREMVTVVDTVNIVETVDVTTTIFVPPGDPRLLAQAFKQRPQIPAHVAAKITPAAPAYVAPKKAAAIPALPTHIMVQPIVNHQAEVVHKNPPPPVKKPVIAAPEGKAVVNKPPVLNNLPVVKKPVAAPVSNVQAGYGSCGEKGGMCNSPGSTTFEGMDGTGSRGTCGWLDNELGEDYFALSHQMMGDSLTNTGPGQPKNPFCGRHAIFLKNGKQIPAVLTDKCPTCGDSSMNVDMSPSLFNKVFGETTGAFPVQWYFTDDPKQY